MDSYKRSSWFSQSEVEHYRTFSYSEIRYSYLGIKFYYGGNVIHKPRFKLGLLPYLQLDVLINEKESNHSQFGSRTIEGSSFVTYYPETNEQFNAVTLRKGIPLLGITLKPEWNTKKFLISPYYSIGITSPWRVRDNWSVIELDGIPRRGDDEFNWFHEFGVSIGYVFSKEA